MNNIEFMEYLFEKLDHENYYMDLNICNGTPKRITPISILCDQLNLHGMTL